jgi:predicted solute-binding protein
MKGKHKCPPHASKYMNMKIKDLKNYFSNLIFTVCPTQIHIWNYNSLVKK